MKPITSRSWFGKCFQLVTVAALPCTAHGDALDYLNWRNPLPTGNNFTAITFGGGLFVAADDAGEILATPDGITWKTVRPVTTNRLNAIAWGGGKFVVVGTGGTVLSSEDAMLWTARSSGTTQMLVGVTYGNGMFVAVGNLGTVVTSPDGVFWTPQIVGSSSSLPRVTFDAGIFVAAGGSGNRVFTSTDGLTWTPRPIDPDPAVYYIWTVGSGDGVFVAIGQRRIGGGTSSQTVSWTSTNGLDWVRASAVAPSGISISFGAGLFLNYNGGFATSTNGVDWIMHALPSGITFVGVAYGNGVFVAAGSGSAVMRSTNGIDWAMTSSGERGFTVSDAVYVNGQYFLAGGNTILISSDLRTFTDATGPGVSAFAIAYGNGKFVALEREQGTLLHSTDGLDWSRVRSGTFKELRSVAYGAGQFVAVASGPFGGAVQISEDGVTWISQWPGTDYPLNDVCYAQGKFVAVGNVGIILTSPNGLEWTPQATDDFNTLYAVNYGNGRFIAVGDDGTVMMSSDGTTWIRKSSALGVSLTSVAAGDDLFVCSGFADGASSIFSSPDGVHWERRQITRDGAVAVFVNDSFLLFGYNGIILQSDYEGAVVLAAEQNLATGDFEVAVHGGQPGRNYRLQSCTNLNRDAWADVTNFSQTQAVTRIFVPPPVPSHQSYYRVVTP